MFYGEVPRGALRAEAAAHEVGEGGGVGGDHSGAGSGFDAHVADGHAAFHGEAADGGAGVLDDVAGGSGGADLADDVEDDVLGGDAGGECAFDVDAEGSGFVLRQGLGGHDVLDFAGADAECECSEGSVGRGVGVTADDGHAGLGEAELGADDVDDALIGGLDVVEFDAEVGAVFAQGLDLFGGDLVDDVEAVFDAGCGDVVVYRGDGAVGAAELAASHAEAVEGLRAGDLVDEMQVNVEDAGFACGFGDEVLVPDFFEEGLWSGLCGRSHFCGSGVAEVCFVDAEAGGWNLVRGSVGVYEDGVGDVRYGGAAGGGFGGPAGDGVDEGGWNVFGGGFICG